MVNPQSAVALIPAREGSKRFARKNMALLGGKPLLAWTLEAAVASGSFSEVVVSSDMPDALRLAADYGAPVRAVERPPEFAGDKATTPQVLADLAAREHWVERGVTSVWLLLPTSPFRDAKHIREAITRLTPEWDALVALKPFHVPVEWAFHLGSDSGLLPLLPDNPLAGGSTRSQGFATAYHPSGAIYGAWLPRFLGNQSFFAGKVCGYVMDADVSQDIDEASDLRLAEAWLRVRGEFKPR